MKVKEKKRVVSRKKQTKPAKTKSVSTKKTARKTKSKNHSGNAKTADKQLQSKNTSPMTAKGKVKRGKPWPKGVSGNPKGRPKLGDTKLDNLLRGIRAVEGKEKINILEDFIKRSLKSDTLAVALMRKLYPDLKSIEQVTLSADSLTKEEANEIRKKLAKRFD